MTWVTVPVTVTMATRDEQKAARIDGKGEAEPPRTTRTRTRDRDEKSDNREEEMPIRLEIPDESIAFIGMSNRH